MQLVRTTLSYPDLGKLPFDCSLPALTLGGCRLGAQTCIVVILTLLRGVVGDSLKREHSKRIDPKIRFVLSYSYAVSHRKPFLIKI